jgi:hypothetical protein
MLQEQSVMLLFLNKSTSLQQKQFLRRKGLQNTDYKQCLKTKKVG